MLAGLITSATMSDLEHNTTDSGSAATCPPALVTECTRCFANFPLKTQPGPCCKCYKLVQITDQDAYNDVLVCISHVVALSILTTLNAIEMVTV
jgi:hypothetical protein